MARADFAATGIRIEGKGYVRSADIEHAQACLEKVLRPLSEPILSARGMLTFHPQDSGERHASAEASLNLNGDVIRAHADAPTMGEAIDALEDRLKNQLDHRSDRHRHDPAGRPASDGAWRHGNLPTSRPPYFDRPDGERELVRHKTFATKTASVEEARWDMSLLDYDFFLFRDEATGQDSVLTAGEDEVVLVQSEAPTLTVEAAIEWLNNTGDRFVFFGDEETERGAVVYRRYDGNYGLLTPR